MQRLRRSCLCLLATVYVAPAFGQSTLVLYANDFENPNVPLTVDCGNSLDARGINFLYGRPGFTYQQVNTVEGVVIADPPGMYTNPSGIGGRYALGMLATAQDDRLALTFDAQGRPFLNVGLDLSPIDVFGCGGPFGTSVPVMQLSLYDSPGGAFSFISPGTLLSRGTITGTSAPDSTTFAWRYGTVGLDASGATTGTVTVVFDLLQSGYAAFDNLSIVVSSTTGVVDRDTDQIADDLDNCPDTPNTDQANGDGDRAGDACDPAPNDPAICGDLDGNGTDDCAPLDAGLLDSGGSADAAGVDGGPREVGLVEPDAQAADAVAAREAGVAAADASAAADGGAGAADAGAGSDDGCGCSTGQRSAPSARLALLALAALWGLRRRAERSMRRRR